LNNDPSSVKRIHLIGICGTAMASLAGMLQAKGYQVAGSDQSVYPPMSTFLERLGIKLFERFPRNTWFHDPIWSWSAMSFRAVIRK
jgi:UDP-N-acetylmuramate: L-alanyl-gamma-D-glutamyl-meso-diaminopimelate ligase